MRKLLLAAITTFAALSLHAQDKRQLEFTIKGAAKDTIYLANYYGNKLYYNDTSVADAQGKVVFRKAAGYKAGIYAVVAPGPKLFEVLVNEPLVQMSSDTSDMPGKVTVQRSEENRIYRGYAQFLTEQRRKADALNKELEGNPAKKATIREQLTQLDKEVKEYQQDLVAKHPGTLAALITRMSVNPDQVEIKKADGTLDSTATYYHYRAHYWDNTDLTDERILRTPVFQNRFDEYIGKVVPQLPDTINKLADDLIRRMGNNEELFKFAVNAITYKYESSDIMGMDAVFVHMAKHYYCPVEKSRATWMTQEKLEKLCERARKLEPIVIGAPSKNIILTDTTEQKWVNMHQLPHDYVVLIFWDPHCGHCKKVMPDIHREYKELLRPLNAEVYAVAKATDSTLFHDWKKYIRENHMEWVNVGLTWHVFEGAKKASYNYIPRYTTIESLNYADAWDVYSTPKFFLLDKERKIVGKQLSVEQMADLIKQLNKRKPSGPAAQ